MSYYFGIVGTSDNPLFEHEFGTSKQGGDGAARFREETRHMNQFIVHSSLDLVDEVQWNSGQTYLKHVDRFNNNFVFCFITGASVKFMLLFNPDTHTPPNARTGSAASARNPAFAQPPSSSYNPAAPAVEDAIKNFFVEVYDAYVKTVMSPFYRLDMKITSGIFRARVAQAARKHL